MANMTFKASLLPNTDLGYSLGSETQRWNIYGNLTGNASSATKATQDGAGNVITSKYVTLDTAQTITGAKTFTQPIYFNTGSGTTRAILGYDASYPNHGITYKEGNPDVMTFSASGNANNTTGGADLSINALGDGVISTRGNIILHAGNYTSYTVTKTGGGASGTWGINITGNAANVTGIVAIAHGGTGATTANGGLNALTYQGGITNANANLNRGLYEYAPGSGKNTPNTNGYGCVYNVIANNRAVGVTLGQSTSNSWLWQIGFDTGSDHPFIRKSINAGTFSSWKNFWIKGDAVTGAVWNDYAEFRQANTVEPGYILIEKGDDTLIKSTKRLQDFAGVSSDTWGFAQGETENAKTPIAVAGRVLVYTDKDRKYFKTGDYVCTGKDGKVSKMHWWEKILFPHKVVGVISSVPEYEEWGGGDRPPVKVDGRVWIKVCQ